MAIKIKGALCGITKQEKELLLVNLSKAIVGYKNANDAIKRT